MPVRSQRFAARWSLSVWIVTCAVTLLVVYGREGLKRMKATAPLSWMLWALAGAGLYYSLYLLNYSMRHFYAYSLVLAVPVAVFIAGLLRIDPKGPVLNTRRNSVLFALLVIAIFRCGPVNPLLPSENEEGFRNIEEIRAVVPKGSSIGYTDCGFYGFFLHDYVVVNMDGILNFEAQRAMEENRMSRYLVENKVEYVLALDNLHSEFARQFETDILSVLEKVEGSDFIYRVRAP